MGEPIRWDVERRGANSGNGASIPMPISAYTRSLVWGKVQGGRVGGKGRGGG